MAPVAPAGPVAPVGPTGGVAQRPSTPLTLSKQTYWSSLVLDGSAGISTLPSLLTRRRTTSLGWLLISNPSPVASCASMSAAPAKLLNRTAWTASVNG